MIRAFAYLSVLASLSAAAVAQTCTGLCLQQVACPNGGTTSISGTVYAPNGTDPLPNVIVFIPNAAVEPFAAGVSCPTPGLPPSGSPLVGTTTAADGTFTLANVPVGANIPIVIQTGRWRRQFVISSTTACTDTAFSGRMPKNQTEGDIPLFAVATGGADSVECVLRKVGLDDSEFTNPMSTGRIHLYSGTSARGARVDASTPSQSTLMSDINQMNKYDVLMLPCQGNPNNQTTVPNSSANFVQYANNGGRVYASHFSYTWMQSNPPFNSVVNWAGNSNFTTGGATINSGSATVNTNFASGKTLASWLQVVGASTTPGQIDISTIKHDFNGVNAPTQSWLTLNDTANGNPTMQFTFNTPVNGANQCGRVLFNEYHVENPVVTNTDRSFPTECSNAAMTPQEKLLEYSLFDLTNDGGAPDFTPSSYDFGSQVVGFATAPQTFTWTNNSIFNVTVNSVSVTSDFLITANNCKTVAAGASCTVLAAFKPSVIGPATGSLTIISGSRTSTAALTGTGTAAISVATTSLAFGSLDVGATRTLDFVITNQAPAAIGAPTLTATGDFTATTCSSTIPAMSSCTGRVTFKPSATGARTGTLTLAGSATTLTAALTGNGVDFTNTLTPSSGNAIAGIDASTLASISPVAGFSATVTVTCTTTAPGSTCDAATGSYAPSDSFKNGITMHTTAKYTVVGYGSFGGKGIAGLILLVASGLLAYNVRRLRPVFVAMVALAVLGLSSGCSGKLPATNATYTAPGTYTYTVTATDGFLVHASTFQLNVTAK